MANFLCCYTYFLDSISSLKKHSAHIILQCVSPVEQYKTYGWGRVTQNCSILQQWPVSKKLKRLAIVWLWLVSWVHPKIAIAISNTFWVVLYPMLKTNITQIGWKTQNFKFLRKRLQKSAKIKLLELQHFAWSHWIHK